MLREITGHLPNVEVVSFQHKLTVDWAKQHGAQVVLRGMRDGKDFNEECIMCANNRQLEPGIETVYLLPSSDFTYISSSAVRAVMASTDGWEFRIGYLVPELVHAMIIEKYGERSRFTDWVKMWRNLLGLETPLADLIQEYDWVRAQYDEPHRSYHTLDHVLHMLDALNSVAEQLKYPDQDRLVVWYHDYVWNPKSEDNESLDQGSA